MKDSSSQVSLKQANTRLKAASLGVTIFQRGQRLYLRATLPPKPGASKLKPHQQHITLHIRANPAGLKHAEVKAKEVGAALATEKFDWQDYSDQSSTQQPETSSRTIGEWLQDFEVDYFNRRKRTPTSENSWKNNYRARFRYLPKDQPLLIPVLEEAIKKTEPDTCTRKGICWVVKNLAKFGGLEYNPKHLAGRYSSFKPAPRNLPSDELIVEWFYKISNPDWRWAYGMIATYGLRPHEVFRLDITDLQQGGSTITVLNGKTGPRQVWPFYLEWIDLFNLREPKELLNQVKSSDTKSNSRLGSVAGYNIRKKEGLPFALYNLRHRWAIRTLEHGLDISLAARQMGHSVMVHSKVYHAWIDKSVQERAFESCIKSSSRPKPPEVIVYSNRDEMKPAIMTSEMFVSATSTLNLQQKQQPRRSSRSPIVDTDVSPLQLSFL